jgi:hypothetical protein
MSNPEGPQSGESHEDAASHTSSQGAAKQSSISKWFTGIRQAKWPGWIRIERSGKDSDEKALYIGSIAFELKVDFLAAFGAAVAVTTAAYQLITHFTGRAHVEVYAPDYVFIYFRSAANTHEIPVVRFVCQVSFINTGDPGRDSILRRASLEITAATEHTSTQYWRSFMKVPTQGSAPTSAPTSTPPPAFGRQVDAPATEAAASAPTKGSPTIRPQLDLAEDSFVSPLLIPGQGTVSKMTSFSAQGEGCFDDPACVKKESDYVTEREFMRQLNQHRGSYLTLTFRATTFSDGEAKPDHCKIRINDQLIGFLAEKPQWIQARCYSDPDLSSVTYRAQ